MSVGRKKQLTGAVGEFLVAAELCRRDVMAAPFAGNVEDYDLVASGRQSGHVPVQVKAINRGTWQFQGLHFVRISFTESPDGKRQRIGSVLPAPIAGLVFVLVLLGKGEDAADRFFVLTHSELATVIQSHYRSWLKPKGGIRPKNDESTHVAIRPDQVEAFEGAWRTILAETA